MSPRPMACLLIALLLLSACTQPSTNAPATANAESRHRKRIAGCGVHVEPQCSTQCRDMLECLGREGELLIPRGEFDAAVNISLEPRIGLQYRYQT